MSLTKQDKDWVEGAFLSRSEFKKFEKGLDRRLAKFLTRSEFEEFEEKLDTKLTKHKSDLMNTMDKILKEILASREVLEIVGPRVVDHEARIEKLEELSLSFLPK